MLPPDTYRGEPFEDWIVSAIRDENMSEISELFCGDGDGWLYRIFMYRGSSEAEDEFIVVWRLCKNEDVLIRLTPLYFDSLDSEDEVDTYPGAFRATPTDVLTKHFVLVREFNEDGDAVAV